MIVPATVSVDDVDLLRWCSKQKDMYPQRKPGFSVF